MDLQRQYYEGRRQSVVNCVGDLGVTARYCVRTLRGDGYGSHPVAVARFTSCSVRHTTLDPCVLETPGRTRSGDAGLDTY